ncbi:MAG: arginyltransferase [Alphaproteobacteria bacterium]
MEELNNQKLFFQRSISFPCSYLSGETEKRLYVNLENLKTINFLVSDLTKNGFRRSHSHMYIPICETCNSCIPSRINVTKFNKSKSNKRILKSNTDLFLVKNNSDIKNQRFKLFHEYCKERHKDSPMSKMTENEFSDFFYKSKNKTVIYDLIDDSQNIFGSILLDCLEDGYSAVYSFFKPHEKKRSLGKLLILNVIDKLKSLDLSFLYLGYWIKSSQKMNYKYSFNNFELYQNGKWIEKETKDF